MKDETAGYRSIRLRRRWFWIILATYAPASLLAAVINETLGFIVAICWMIAFGASVIVLWRSRCPHCGERCFIQPLMRRNPWAKRCLHCGISLSAPKGVHGRAADGVTPFPKGGWQFDGSFSYGQADLYGDIPHVVVNVFPERAKVVATDSHHFLRSNGVASAKIEEIRHVDGQLHFYVFAEREEFLACRERLFPDVPIAPAKKRGGRG